MLSIITKCNIQSIRIRCLKITAKALLVEIKDIFDNQLKSSSNNVTNQSIDVILTLEKDLGNYLI